MQVLHRIHLSEFWQFQQHPQLTTTDGWRSTEAEGAAWDINPAYKVHWPKKAHRAELKSVNVSCTQKSEALLSSFCQQVAKADGHHPHYIQTPIFTLLAESGSRGTCCSSCSISASDTELWTETAGSRKALAHAHDSCSSTAKMDWQETSHLNYCVNITLQGSIAASRANKHDAREIFDFLWILPLALSCWTLPVHTSTNVTLK